LTIIDKCSLAREANQLFLERVNSSSLPRTGFKYEGNRCIFFSWNRCLLSNRHCLNLITWLV